MTLHLGVGVMRAIPDRPKVLLVDLDPQCNLSFLALGVNGYVNRVYHNNQATLKEMFGCYFSSIPFDITTSILK